MCKNGTALSRAFPSMPSHINHPKLEDISSQRPDSSVLFEFNEALITILSSQKTITHPASVSKGRSNFNGFFALILRTSHPKRG